jgi:hypothetical protein
MYFTVPAEAAALQIYLACNGASCYNAANNANMCNTFVPLDVATRQLSVNCTNYTGQTVSLVPNFYYHTAASGFWYGTTSGFAVTPGVQAPPPTVSLTATPTSANITQLAWSSSNVETCLFTSDGPVPTQLNNPGFSGSASLSLQAKQTFTYTCSSIDGRSASASAIVYGPIAVSASPGVIPSGGTTVLSFTVPGNAAALQLYDACNGASCRNSSGQNMCDTFIPIQLGTPSLSLTCTNYTGHPVSVTPNFYFHTSTSGVWIGITGGFTVNPGVNPEG